MRVFILTQDDPFYLGENLAYLINNLPNHSQIVGAVIFNASPFGKRETFIQKLTKTYKVFGASFFCYYSLRFLGSKLRPGLSVVKILEKHGIPLLKIDGNINAPDNLEKIKSFNPDLLVSILGNQIFKSKLIHLAPKGCLNLHTALLPKYRGLMPTFWVLKNNEKQTGVSVFFVDEGIDSGPIVVQKKVIITPSHTQASLIRETKKIGMDAIIEAVDLIERDKVVLIDNPAEEMTYFSFPSAKDVKEFKKAGKKFF